MPTIFRLGPYRYFFYSSDKNEPIHIHIEREDKIAKFWLDPVRLQNSDGFNRKEITHIFRNIEKHHQQLMETWHEYFGK